MRRTVALVSIWFVLGMAPAAHAADSLDVRTWTERSGVRLLAVEFYATWCKPCMEAVPKWKALHERYRDLGLRLVVVSTQDPEGQCINPGWAPDEMVCDPDGELARALGVGDRLPAAFLWSWQGNLLVRAGHVAEVDRAVRTYLKKNPRVVVEAKDPAVARLVRHELVRAGKMAVVATDDEREALEAIRRDSHGARFDDKLACKLGEEVPANALLKAAITGRGRKQKLALQLFSAESSCLLAAAAAPWVKRQAERAAGEATDKLLSRLRSRVQMPGRAQRGGALARLPTETAPEKPKRGAFRPTLAASVSVQSEPPGAIVRINGTEMGQTPWTDFVTPGQADVEVVLPYYKTARRRLDIAPQPGGRTQVVRFELEANFGTLEVRTEPAGATIHLDGREAGEGPWTSGRLNPGLHELRAELSHHDAAEEQVRVVAGEHRELTLTLRPRLGAVQVLARSGDGHPVEARLRVDGERAGSAPRVLELLEGRHVIEARDPEGVLDDARELVVVREGETQQLALTLEGERPAAASPVRAAEPPAGIAAEMDAQPDEGDARWTLSVASAVGALRHDGAMVRQNASVELAAGVRAGPARFEFGIVQALEAPNALLLRPGLRLGHGAFRTRLAWQVLVKPETTSGVLLGVGPAFALGGGWELELGLDGSWWPRADGVVGAEGRLEVRHGW